MRTGTLAILLVQVSCQILKQDAWLIKKAWHIVAFVLIYLRLPGQAYWPGIL
jgi:hypothetical protein